jgi:hypothetical protein
MKPRDKVLMQITKNLQATFTHADTLFKDVRDFITKAFKLLCKAMYC